MIAVCARLDAIPEPIFAGVCFVFLVVVAAVDRLTKRRGRR